VKLSLYQTASCPYCRRVLRAAEALGVEIELRDVQREPERWRELIDATGRRTVPCLRIESDDGSVEWMHESRDIVAHLEAL
jgi:glutaredoxin